MSVKQKGGYFCIEFLLAVKEGPLLIVLEPKRQIFTQAKH